jgi:hypothetical protein
VYESVIERGLAMSHQTVQDDTLLAPLVGDGWSTRTEKDHPPEPEVPAGLGLTLAIAEPLFGSRVFHVFHVSITSW